MEHSSIAGGGLHPKDMGYKKSLDIGRSRAEEAAEIICRWTGLRAMAVCAVKPTSDGDPRTTGDWEPVGQQSRKEIARDGSHRGGGNSHLLVVDEDGTAKACSRDRFLLGEVLRLADRIPIAVVISSCGELWRKLEEEDQRVNEHYHALHVEV